LPKQRDGQDRYYGVGYKRGRVVFYQMHFAPQISLATAKRLIRAEFPSNSRSTAEGPTQGYEQIDYCSATLRLATGHQDVRVWLLFGHTQRLLVEDAIVQAGSDAAC